MKDENLEVSRRMFKHACAFLDCASFCQIEPNNIEYRMSSHTVAGIVNSAFACEIWRRWKWHAKLQYSGCICRFALGFCKNK